MAGTAQSSGLLGTGTFQVTKGRGVLSAAHAVSDGTNVATITLYDNDAGTATGTVLAKVNGSVTTGSNGAIWTTPVRYEFGIVAVISGTGTPQGLVYWGA